jgi:hypothetical protein
MIIKRLSCYGKNYKYCCWKQLNTDTELHPIIIELMNDKNKCLLYTKSDNIFARLLSLFLLKRDKKHYDVITLNVFGPQYELRAYEDNKMYWEEFIYVDYYKKNI